MNSDTRFLTFPVKSPALRRHLMREDVCCPECGGLMDVGYECNDCGFDGMPEIEAARVKQAGDA
ncbi:hypothetical protein [Burkholderia sp. AU32262]|uniref:hypothetical protein n=1 Tax=Burkholderia sp. AU32262 TaxID=2879630 RepID=UPI001CF0D79E|nr:hypothetical protein [Burkholderia sp. AU32262]MCA8239868.1 hypothetical protein [Burkholderia sp. AU32262]